MQLWLLEGGDSPAWSPWYDKAFSFVVRAETEQEARQFAAKNCGVEGPDAWNDPKQSTCKPLAHDGEPGVVLRDYAAA